MTETARPNRITVIKAVSIPGPASLKFAGEAIAKYERGIREGKEFPYGDMAASVYNEEFNIVTNTCTTKCGWSVNLWLKKRLPGQPPSINQSREERLTDSTNRITITKSATILVPLALRFASSALEHWEKWIASGKPFSNGAISVFDYDETNDIATSTRQTKKGWSVKLHWIDKIDF
jgi:hypothetical protein